MKPKIDISDNPSRWTMGKRISDALGDNTPEQNRFLSEFNPLAPLKGNDEEILDVLLQWADFVIDGDVLSAGESVTIEPVEESTDIVVTEDPRQLATDATDYLGAIQTIDVVEQGYENVVTLLADVKELLGKIDEKRKDLTRGARDTVTKINAEFAPAISTYGAAEELLKAKLVEFRSEVDSIRGRMLEDGEEPIEPVPEVNGVTVLKNYDIQVNKSDLPLIYLMPDMKAIRKAVKAGEEISGVTAEEIEALSVEHRKVKR